MQSLNLCAALLRALEAAKKKGVLGRESVVRKTMLDECKGERLEEVLACFSTVVLKRILAQQAPGLHNRALAVDFVLEDRGYRGDNAELVALTLAHRFTLRPLLERREAARSRYREFARLLDAEERAVTHGNGAPELGR